MVYNIQCHQCSAFKTLPLLSVLTRKLYRCDSHTRGQWICCNMSSGTALKRGKGACVFVRACWGKRRGVFLHMCVFRELVLTQTQPLHCPSPSQARMFEGRLIAWLPLISAGTDNPAAGRPRSLEDAVSTRTREAQDREHSWDGYCRKLWSSQLQITHELF